MGLGQLLIEDCVSSKDSISLGMLKCAKQRPFNGTQFID